MRLDRIYRRPLGAMLGLLTVGTALAAGGTMLRLEPSAGTTQRYALTQTQNMEMGLGALGTQKTDATMRFEYRQTVAEKRKDGSLAMELVFDRIALDVSGSFKLSYDSAAEGGGGDGSTPMARMERMLLGRKFTLQVSPRGEIGEVGGFRAAWDAMAEELGDDPAAKQLLEALRDSFNEKTVQNMMSPSGLVLPEKRVKSGDTWSDVTHMTNPVLGEVEMQNRYRLVGSGDAGVEVALEFGMTANGKGAIWDQMGQLFGSGGADVAFAMQIEDGTGAGTIHLDRETGMLLHSTVQQKVTGSATFDITQGENSQQMVIQLGIDQDVRVERID